MLPSVLFAQLQKERRVYFLDCSYSMVQLKIWGKVCANLEMAIDKVTDETTDLYVIPFARGSEFYNGNLQAFHQKATQEGKAKLISDIKALGNPQKSSMTYHPDPILDFYKNRVAPDGWITYMFLMTDGQDEYNPRSLFLEKLKEWGGRYGEKTVYGFYVMLDPTAKNPDVESIVEEQPHFWNVSSADVDIKLTRTDTKAVINVRNEKYVDVPVYGPTNGYDIEVTSGDQDYSVTKREFVDGKLRLYVSGTQDLSTLPTEKKITIKLKVNKTPSQYDFWVSDKITLTCKNKKEPAIISYSVK